MFTYINKDWNIIEFTGTQHQIDCKQDELECISGTWFEPREQVKVKEVKKEEVVEENPVENELTTYINILKTAKVKGAHLISDVERAKAKCVELNLL